MVCTDNLDYARIWDFPLRFFILVTAFYFFNDTATTEIYTLSLHDALPISAFRDRPILAIDVARYEGEPVASRSEEHTSELQSPVHLVCRLLLEKKNSQSS